jgi:hypothetical protein
MTIPLWKRMTDWWNSDFNKKPATKFMTVDELKNEYKGLYEKICTSDGHSAMDVNRMIFLEAELKSRGWYILKGVGCDFAKK